MQRPMVFDVLIHTFLCVCTDVSFLFFFWQNGLTGLIITYWNGNDLSLFRNRFWCPFSWGLFRTTQHIITLINMVLFHLNEHHYVNVPFGVDFGFATIGKWFSIWIVQQSRPDWIWYLALSSFVVFWVPTTTFGSIFWN